MNIAKLIGNCLPQLTQKVFVFRLDSQSFISFPPQRPSQLLKLLKKHLTFLPTRTCSIMSTPPILLSIMMLIFQNSGCLSRHLVDYPLGTKLNCNQMSKHADK